MPETRAIALPTALLVATAALAGSIAVACAFLLVALVAVAGHAAVALHDGTWATWCGAAAGACGTVAALIGLTRTSGGLRPAALAAAWAIAFAWPLTGAAPAAIAATVATGFVVRWGASGAHPARDRAPAAAGLATIALLLLAAAFGGAPDEARPDERAVRADDRAAPANEHAARADERPGASDERPGAADERATPPPARVVRAYYRALDRRDFVSAWRALAPVVRAGFGGFEHWQAGFATTLSSRPRRLRVSAAGGAAIVDHVLTARDRADCGVLVQRFSVRWRLLPTPSGWRAGSIRAVASPARRCSA